MVFIQHLPIQPGSSYQIKENITTESVGLADGLVGLFSFCQEAVEKVQSYLAFSTSTHVLGIPLSATMVCFKYWDRRVRSH